MYAKDDNIMATKTSLSRRTLAITKNRTQQMKSQGMEKVVKGGISWFGLDVTKETTRLNQLLIFP